MQIYIGFGVAFTVLVTFLSLQFNDPHWVSMVITILGGAPMSSISVISY
jgi:hypothetical protein